MTFLFTRTTITKSERGFLFRNRDFVEILEPGVHKFFDPVNRLRIDVIPVNRPVVVHRELDSIIRSGAFGDLAEIVDVKDNERALVWIDGRFTAILSPGMAALWKIMNDVRVEKINIATAQFEHADFRTIVNSPVAREHLDLFVVENHQTGLLFVDGRFVDSFAPGVYAFWKAAGRVTFRLADRREQSLDVAGQDIMTSDRVTLRLNALVKYRIVDPVVALSEVADCGAALYREAQLALRAAIGTRDLDAVLADKDALTNELHAALAVRGSGIGVEVTGFGIRDVILPGDMRELLNKVTEARKSAEAALITRREETAAMRHQANSAKLLDANPALLRLRELETLEKIAPKTNLTVILGEKGLAEHVTKLV